MKTLPRLRVRTVGCTVALGLVLWCEPGWAGPVEAGLGLGLRLYDHQTPFNEPATYQARTVTPMLRIRRDNGVTLLDLAAERRFEFYPSDPGLDTLLGTGTHTADRASLEARHQWSDLDQVAARAQYVRSRDLLDIDQGTITSAGDQRRWDVGTTGSVWRTEGSFALGDRHYQEPGTSDARNIEWTARALPLRLPGQALFAGFTQQRIDLDRKDGAGEHPVFDKHLPHVGYRRAITPSLKAELTGGVAQVDFGDGTLQRRAAFGAALTRRDDAPVSFRFEVGFEGDSLSLARANLSRALGNGAIWLSGESVPEAEGGFQSYPTVSRRITGGVRDTLGRANVLGFETSYERDRPLHFAGPLTETLRATGWLLRRMQPWLEAKVGASFLRQPVFLHSDEPLYRRLRMDAELTALLP